MEAGGQWKPEPSGVCFLPRMASFAEDSGESQWEGALRGPARHAVCDPGAREPAGRVPTSTGDLIDLLKAHGGQSRWTRSRRGRARGHHPRQGCRPSYSKTSVHTSTGGCGAGLDRRPQAVAAVGAEAQAEAGSGGLEGGVCPKRGGQAGAITSAGGGTGPGP